ncbi:sensor domain-containing diguanylate cyclase [Methylobrevis sp. L22]|uniref:diguanylate cyclase n=1 Tax=Methylobrevis albus TaxID=2793297 RepID=A0A931I5I9_9HYPH|nr:sensor domain-containing diguanylate cyclase [Methylobrevis albus]
MRLDDETEGRRLEALDACAVLDAPPDGRFARLTRLASRYFAADTAFITLIDDTYQWVIERTTNHVDARLTRDESLCNLMVVSAEPLVIGDIASDPRIAGHPITSGFPLRFYAGAPLLARPGLAIGSLCIMRREPGDPNDFDLEALVDFAGLATDEIELTRRNRELAHLSETDPLTSLLNRRGFEASFERARRRSRRTGLPLSLLLIDLDHFKALNDSVGHEAGDVALRRSAAILGGAVRRPDDVVARFGGEEFVLLLPETGAEGARFIAEGICTAFAAANLPHPGTWSGRISVSIGIATCRGEDAMDEGLLARADEALYRAKRGGRDRVESAP